MNRLFRRPDGWFLRMLGRMPVEMTLVHGWPCESSLVDGAAARKSMLLRVPRQRCAGIRSDRIALRDREFRRPFFEPLKVFGIQAPQLAPALLRTHHDRLAQGK
jgi:hypothetical protein